MHQKQINDLQLQHQEEVAALLKEKDQQLKDETAATVTGKEKSKDGAPLHFTESGHDMGKK